jgi:cytochrome c oxidase subunit 2
MTGEFDMQCAEICGIGHGVMVSRIYIEDEQAHTDWIQSASVASAQ